MQKSRIKWVIVVLLVSLLCVAAVRDSLSNRAETEVFLPLLLSRPVPSKIRVLNGDWYVGNTLYREWGMNSPENAFSPATDTLAHIDALCDMGMNSMYVTLHNIGGDGDDTEFSAETGYLFRSYVQHANACGIVVHLVLAESEAENKAQWGGWHMTNERQNFFLHVTSLFHDLNVTYVLCEECDSGYPLNVQNIASMGEALKQLDPYTPVGVHMLRLQAYYLFAGVPTIDYFGVQLFNTETELDVFYHNIKQYAPEKVVSFWEWCSLDLPYCTPERVRNAAARVPNVSFYVASQDTNMPDVSMWSPWVARSK